MSQNETNGFYFTELEDGWEVGRFRALDELDSVVHMVTTRRGPNPAEIASHPADAGLKEMLKLSGLAWCEQVHGSKVLLAGESGMIGQGDGIVSIESSLGVTMFSADCPLILAVDKVRGAIGMAHASWRSTVGRVAMELIVSMACRFGTRAEHVVACIGPSAGPCCYEVGREVRREAVERIGDRAKEFFIHHTGRLHFDLWEANRDELLRSGLLAENIHVAGQCTICNNDRFPSYRAEGEQAGRFAAVLAVR